jgi:thiol-disulfide isomerase/thioredoxin
VKNGKFTIEGEKVDSVGMSSIVASDGSAGALFFKENGNIDVTISRNKPPKVGGTKSNKGWQKINELQEEYGKKFEALENSLYLDGVDAAQREKIQKEYEALEQEMLVKFVDTAEDNIGNEMGYFIVTSMAGSKALPAERLRGLVDKMPQEFRQRAEVVEIEKALEVAKNTAKGKKIPDFSLPTPDGDEMDIMSLVSKNKVTILDFWASWCAPCCEEMPLLVSFYEQNRDKGLGIVGISLDHEKDNWLEAIEKMNMTWPQLGDMKSWNTPPVELFQVRAIPYTIVVDQNGTILEKGLRGTELELFVESKLY